MTSCHQGPDVVLADHLKILSDLTSAMSEIKTQMAVNGSRTAVRGKEGDRMSLPFTRRYIPAAIFHNIPICQFQFQEPELMSDYAASN